MKIIQITTDEEYINYLKNEKETDIIGDFRSGKNTILCAFKCQLSYGDPYDYYLPILSDFIKDRFDNGYGLPDKIFIIHTTEPSFDMDSMNRNFLSLPKYSNVPFTNANIECTFINGDIAITSTAKKSALYNKDYIKLNNVYTENIKTYGFPFGLLSRTRKRLIELHANNKIADYTSTPTKHFICLNAKMLTHRIQLVTWLHKINIINKCHWSWLRRKANKEQDNNLEEQGFTEKEAFDYTKTKILDISLEDLMTDINQDTVSDFYYLTDSLIDIGCESFPDNFQFITEKTWKPYLHGKVSFFFNCQSYYAILKNLGFELYDEIFDYSFDTIKDDEERLVGYRYELKRISEIPIEELQKKIVSIKDKILRNRNHAWNCDLKTISPFKEYPTLLP